MRLRYLLAMLALGMLMPLAPTPAAAQQLGVDVQAGGGGGDVYGIDFFYDALAPYGNWVQSADYGWVWCPANVGADWRPYTEGHWALTDEYGWMWVSDTPYGWACDHYGRWYNDDDYGWSWVPDTHWGPSWVAWREGEGCIGWAPLPPEFRIGAWGEHVRIDVSVDVINRLRPHEWCFVRERDFGRAHYDRSVYLPERQSVTIINNTTNITNYVVENNRIINRSIDPVRIERVSAQPIRRVHVEASTRGGAGERNARVEGNTVRIYQPRIEQRTSARPAPPPQIVQKSVREAPKLRERNQTYVKTLQAQGVTVEPRRREMHRPETTTPGASGAVTAPGARPGVPAPGTRPGERRPEVTTPGTTRPPEVRTPRTTQPPEVTTPRTTRPPEVTTPRTTRPPEVTTPRTTRPPEVTTPRTTRPPEVTTPRTRHPEVTTPAPAAPRVEQPRPAPAAPRVEQPRPAPAAPRVEQPRPAPAAPRVEQPRPAPAAPRVEQPRPAPAAPRVEQPRPAPAAPRVEQPRPAPPPPRVEQPRQ